MSKKRLPKTSLVIVESPSKCRKIEEYLGDGFKCVASCGHLRELVSLDNIDIEHGFQPTFTNISIKQKQINTLRKEIRDAAEVIIATDDDREGEAIGWHICQLFGLNIEITKRIVFHEITRDAIQTAITIPSRINMDVIRAQHARQIMDLLVGFKITPTLWANIHKTTRNKKSLSAGRCQSPALRLVYDNYKKIIETPMKQIYKTIGYFTSLCIPFELEDEECERNQDKNEIIEFLKKSAHFSHMMTCESTVKKIKSPPEPFTTSLLQQRASSELRFSPSDTMKTCQSLYESGYITYMRTDSKKYSNEFLCKTRNYILKTYNAESVNNTEGQGQGQTHAHEAIRPTNISLSELTKEEGSKERKLYKLIWKNTLTSCMSPAIYNSLKTTITSPYKKYSYTCEVPHFLGWKIVDYKPTKEEKYYHYLLNLKKVEAILYKKITIISTMNQKIGHYCEARLVQQLEKCGIGRPSTFASLVEKIQDRGYVSKMNVEGVKVVCVDYELEDDGTINEIALEKEFGGETGKLVLEPIGLQVVEYLERHFMDLFNYDYTKKLEDELDAISQGNKVWNELCADCNSQIDSLLKHSNIHKVDKIEEEQTKVEEEQTKVEEEQTKVEEEQTKVEEEQTKVEEEQTKAEQVSKYKDKKNEKYLGVHLEQDIILKKGKFGLYFVWNDSNVSLKTNRGIENITIDDVISLICREKNNTNTSTSMRKISDSISIRQGKVGKSDYLFFKTEKMKKPSFLSIEGYNGDYKTDDVSAIKSWIREKYGIY
jgi:DNA topoisomerase-1